MGYYDESSAWVDEEIDTFPDVDWSFLDGIDPWVEAYEPPTTVELDWMSGPNVAVAKARYGDEYTVVGDSKRNKGETYNEQVGVDLAVGRALVQLGKLLIDRAYASLPGGES